MTLYNIIRILFHINTIGVIIVVSISHIKSIEVKISYFNISIKGSLKQTIVSICLLILSILIEVLIKKMKNIKKIGSSGEN